MASRKSNKQRIGGQVLPGGKNLWSGENNDDLVSKKEFEKALEEIKALKEQIKKLEKNSSKDQK